MKEYKNLIERFAAVSSLETEALPGLPLVELVGNRRVLIENHCGVLQYSDNGIWVKVKNGQLVISGTKLELARMTKEQLIIIGQIESVQVYNGRQQ